MVGTGGGIKHVTLLAVIPRKNASNSITEVAITLQQLFFTMVMTFHGGNAASLSHVCFYGLFYVCMCHLVLGQSDKAQSVV